jgi:sugar phosphate isomerase/epimerase
MFHAKITEENRVSRRAWILGGAAALATAAAPAAPRKLKIAIFSKHLQFVQGDGLAKAAADIGFDAIDITVRKGGHVEPERVAQDLPPLVTAIRAHNLDVPMITTDIVDTDSPYTEAILQMMAKLGIRYYRWNTIRYTPDKPIEAQLEQMKPRVARLAALNAKHRVCAMYHTHSGRNMVGASIWDLHILLKDQDPQTVGVNFDIGHATIEGGVGGWINSFNITGKYLRGIAVKDFVWGKDAKGAWTNQWRPLGEGMVHLPEFFGMVAATPFDGPLQLHFEYKLPDEPEAVYTAMRRDLTQLRGYLAKAGL